MRSLFLDQKPLVPQRRKEEIPTWSSRLKWFDRSYSSYSFILLLILFTLFHLFIPCQVISDRESAATHTSRGLLKKSWITTRTSNNSFVCVCVCLFFPLQRMRSRDSPQYFLCLDCLLSFWASSPSCPIRLPMHLLERSRKLHLLFAVRYNLCHEFYFFIPGSV